VQFTRLRLSGFKSFVDPTELVIAGGLTGVVGPNGCGKSNLLEALRWVMGENRPTSMRGGGMEDVIFAGAATRPARNFAEVSLTLDNAERLAPTGFNDSDVLEIVRRITRDVGSAYKTNGRDVRAGIGGLYQRPHEADLKLKAAESNLERVDDILEQLASQLHQLAKQARQAARYREIGSELRRVEGMLLYRRWREADDTRLEAEGLLRTRTTEAAQSEIRVREAVKARMAAEEALPALREEAAIAAALVQRLTVQRDTLADEESRAQRMIETLGARISQLGRDMEREAGLNRDAGETIAGLEREAAEIAEASEGFEAALSEATEAAQEAARVLQAREYDLGQQTEDAARLSARGGARAPRGTRGATRWPAARRRSGRRRHRPGGAAPAHRRPRRRAASIRRRCC